MNHTVHYSDGTIKQVSREEFQAAIDRDLARYNDGVVPKTDQERQAILDKMRKQVDEDKAELVRLIERSETDPNFEHPGWHKQSSIACILDITEGSLGAACRDRMILERDDSGNIIRITLRKPLKN